MLLRETIADYSHNSINSNGIRYSGKIQFFFKYKDGLTRL